MWWAQDVPEVSVAKPRSYSSVKASKFTVSWAPFERVVGVRQPVDAGGHRRSESCASGPGTRLIVAHVANAPAVAPAPMGMLYAALLVATYGKPLAVAELVVVVNLGVELIARLPQRRDASRCGTRRSWCRSWRMSRGGLNRLPGWAECGRAGGIEHIEIRLIDEARVVAPSRRSCARPACRESAC